MPLKIIGTGQGRTGTASLKLALEQLGFGKCYHMFELFQHPEDVDYFEKAERGEQVDWDALFTGYQSAVDFPVIRFYHQLLEKYPEAKAIHTIREEESWFKSASETIFSASKPSFGRMLKMAIRLPFSQLLRKRLRILKFNGKMLDKEFGNDRKNKSFVINKYREHNAEVLKSIPSERLLVYEVKNGWEPLCKFLNVPVPTTPFPKSNTTDDFVARVKNMLKGDKVSKI